MIDREKFDEQYSFFDTETLSEIIDIFADEKDDRIEAIRKNHQDKNYGELSRNSHSLKGVIGNFMDPVTYSLSQALEEAARAGNEDSVTNLIPALEKACSELVIELKKIRELQSP